MKKAFAFMGTIVVGLVAVLALYGCQPERMTKERLKQARETQARLEEAEAKEKAAETGTQTTDEPAKPEAAKPAAVDVSDLTPVPVFDGYDGGKGPDAATLIAPQVFLAQFDCSNGTFVMECHREWSPLGVDRLYNLIVQGFFDETRFFRVVPGFVVQFGISGSPSISAKWDDATIQDEPAKQGNKKGMVTFAKSQMPNSRTTQIFINLGDNQGLDPQGFAAVGKIVRGMEVVEAINAEYAQMADQMMIEAQGNDYLDKMFPDMDYVKKAFIVQKAG